MQQPIPGNDPQNLFARVPSADINRSSFARDSEIHTAFDAGYLIPFFWDDALPGDTMSLRVSALARLATPKFPLFSPIFLDMHFFAVPKRLLDVNFVKMMGEQDNPDDSIDFTEPKLDKPNGVPFALNSIYDYFGLPIGISRAMDNINADMFRAYNQTWKYWYRDQNLQDSPPINTDAGPDDLADYTLLPRAARHDQFTSGLPSAQKGVAPSIPIGVSAPVNLVPHTTSTSPMLIRGAADGTLLTGRDPLYTDDGSTAGAGALLAYDAVTPSVGVGVVDPNGRLVADLSTATAANINLIRQLTAIQHVLERDMRGGTRYPEMVHSHFGVLNPDSRMQYPEYLGGGTIRCDAHAIPNTSGTGTGDLAAFANAYEQHAAGFTHSFTEHSVVIGLVSARSPRMYYQGLDRRWTKTTRYDHYLPDFANLGEQEILKQELMVTETEATDLERFNFNERWSEYRYKKSALTSLMRPNAAGTLAAWHTAPIFTAAVFDEAFIVEQPDIDRCIQVPSQPHFIFDAQLQLNHVRPLPLYSVPGLRTL